MNQTEAEPRQELVRSRCSTQHFLLSQTEATVHRDISEQRYPAGSKRLVEHFPDVPAGATFLHTALDRFTASPSFEVVTIRIDNFKLDEARQGQDPNVRLQKAVADVVDATCRENEGVWGILDADIFGCFFKVEGNTPILKKSEKLRDILKATTQGTVSIGYATYPSLDYDRSQILENALKALDHAAFFGPGSVVGFDSVSLNISADQLYQHGDLNGAVGEFEHALALDPNNVNVHNSLGVCYGILGDLDRALEEFETVLGLEPAEVMATYNTGLVHMLKGEKEKALEYFQKANEREELFETAFQTGRVHLERNEPEEAKPYFERATRLNPDAATAYRYLGDCLSALEERPAAIDAYKKGIKKNPNDAASLSGIGYLFHEMGENPEIAEIFCRQSVAIEPDNGMYRHRLAQVLLRQNLPLEALDQFRKASALGSSCRQQIEMLTRDIKTPSPAEAFKKRTSDARG
ncbi:hypothetical protein D3OALGA1CA_1240 [Olavius algarvensis associated proteobacterium Delta 3]|nr:hypothetical protein D3OALGA1CA_1240 [Olavius algarvensis associated proteobacterium Delta 3]